MTLTAKRFKPQSFVKVYTEQGELVARSKAKKEGEAVDSQVLTINTNNDLATDAAVFTVTLALKDRWDLVIASNDLIIIGMSKDPKESEDEATVFYGLVDSVETLSTIESGQVQQQVTITGRSFAKALINFEIGVVQDAGEIGTSVGWLRGRINFTGQSSAQIVQQLFDVFVKKYMNYTFSNGKTLMDMLKLDLHSREGESMIGETTFVNYQGSIYNFCKELIDEPFNQMFFEVYNGVPTLVLRATPFNEEPWKKLPLHTVEEDEIVAMQISRNDLETYTLFSVGVSNHFGTFGSEGTLGVKPLVYEPYLKKYGIRRLHRYSNYIGMPMQSGTDMLQPLPNISGNTAGSPNLTPSPDSRSPADLARKYAIDLFNWNVMNPSFYSGTVIVSGSNKFKLGDRLLLRYKSRDVDGKIVTNEMEFFIEGIQQDFVNFSYWRTHLSVTRGLPKKGEWRFKNPWGQYKEYQGGGVGDPTQSELEQLNYEENQWLLQQLGFGGYASWSDGGFSSGVSGGTRQVAQYYLSSTFKQLNNFGENRGDHIHKGEDMAAPTGTPIYALFDGKVTKNSYQAGGAGNYIVLQHANGIVTKYFHMRDRSKVPVGAQVKAGDLIGYVGSTGRSTGSHLHLEIWVNGQVKNPVPILKQLANSSSSSGSPSSSGGWWGAGGVISV